MWFWRTQLRRLRYGEDMTYHLRGDNGYKMPNVKPDTIIIDYV